MSKSKTVIFEIASDDKFLLNLKKSKKDEYRFKYRLKILREYSVWYKKLKWASHFNNLYNELDLIELEINDILNQSFSDQNNKMLQSWLNQLRLLLPKIQQAKQDCLNNSWNWLDIKW